LNAKIKLRKNGYNANVESEKRSNAHQDARRGGKILSRKRQLQGPDKEGGSWVLHRGIRGGGGGRIREQTSKIGHVLKPLVVREVSFTGASPDQEKGRDFGYQVEQSPGSFEPGAQGRWRTSADSETCLR